MKIPKLLAKTWTYIWRGLGILALGIGFCFEVGAVYLLITNHTTPRSEITVREIFVPSLTIIIVVANTMIGIYFLLCGAAWVCDRVACRHQETPVGRHDIPQR